MKLSELMTCSILHASSAAMRGSTPSMTSQLESFLKLAFQINNYRQDLVLPTLYRGILHKVDYLNYTICT